MASAVSTTSSADIITTTLGSMVLNSSSAAANSNNSNIRGNNAGATTNATRRSRPSTPPQAASLEEVAEMKEVFACFDKDSSGSVTTAELGHVLKSMNKNYNDSELKRIVGKFDVNGDGQIDFDEFLTMMTKTEKKEADELKQAFDVFDKDGDGTISGKELEIVMKALGEHIDRETIDLMIESVDTDKNGYIDFEEFRRMMKDGPVEFK